MNPFRLSTRVRPSPKLTRGGPASISAAVRARASPPGSSDAVRAGSGAGEHFGAHAGERPGAAIEVPWRISARSATGMIEVEHRGAGPAHSVRFALAGNGVLGLSLPGTVLPGERVRVVVRGGAAGECAASAGAMLMLRWFEADGREFLWPIALE